MYCNLSKTQALPMASRFSIQQPLCFNPVCTSKIRFSSHGVYPKPSLNPTCYVSVRGSHPRAHEIFQIFKARNISLSFGRFCAEFVMPRSQFNVFRSYCSMSNDAVRNGEGRVGKDLPWLSDSNRVEKAKRREKAVKVNASSSGGGSSKSSWEISAERLLQRSGSSSVKSEGMTVDRWHKPGFDRDEGDVDDGDGKVVSDPRWNRIKTRVGRVVNGRSNDKPQMRRWDAQESWGRKIYREASESSVPKLTGEGVYGVGPVLAALSAGRREFYTLYVQEGLELSKNNKKKKDKKGFEKVLKIVDKIGLSIREISKHDLNMVSDNRPHQGLVLDASPLEMVNIRELDPVSSEDNKGALWVALDEVTDPQNLGAIIRSSYFFGAAGVVLCAKNSAPLSGVVSKASAGSLELMEMRSCKNMMQFLTSSAENGWRVVGGSVSSRAVPVRDVEPGEPTILVLGSEGTGLRPLVERSCTQLVRIPGNIPVDISAGRLEDDEDGSLEEQTGEEYRSFMAVESLNVSVAAGVLLHHFIGNNYASLVESGDLDTNALG